MLFRMPICCILILLIASKANSQEAICSTSADCVPKSNCTVDFCEPFQRRCMSINPSSACQEGLFYETTRSILVKLAESPKFYLNLSEKLLVVTEAEKLFRDVHAHRDFHLNFLKLDPAAHFKSYAEQLLCCSRNQSTVEFHQRLIRLYQLAEDRHTSYNLPEPWSEFFAFLPFQIRDYFNGTSSRYVVSDVAHNPSFSSDSFRKGVEVLKLDNLSIEDAVLKSGKQGYSSNSDSKKAVGLRLLTFRFLEMDRIPTRDNSIIEYRNSDGALQSIRVPWRYATTSKENLNRPGSSGLLLSTVNRQPPYLEASPDADPMAEVSQEPLPSQDLSDLVFLEEVRTIRGPFSRISILQFGAVQYEKFLERFRRLLFDLPSANGLIIDVRGNDGGDPRQCQGIVQYFTKKQVKVLGLQTRVTPTTLRMARLNRASIIPEGSYVREYLTAETRTANVSQIFAQQFFGDTLLTEELANSYKGARFNGSVVVLTDAETYSCGDVFAAVVQDSEAAPVVGVDGATGGGGGNVFLGTLYPVLYPDIFKEMPQGIILSTTNPRLVRNGKNKGTPLEFFGVTPDIRYHYTRADRLERDRDLNLFLKDMLTKLQRNK